MYIITKGKDELELCLTSSQEPIVKFLVRAFILQKSANATNQDLSYCLLKKVMEKMLTTQIKCKNILQKSVAWIFLEFPELFSGGLQGKNIFIIILRCFNF